MLVSITATWLRGVELDAALGRIEHADGSDIYFTATGTLEEPKLPQDVESYDPAAGSLLAWVRVPSLTNAADALYIHYGDCVVTDPPPGPSVVWQAYAGVWHMQDDPGAGETNAAQGQIGGGRLFDQDNNSDDSVQLAAQSITDDVFAAGGMVSAWIRPVSSGEEGAGFIASKLVQPANCQAVPDCNGRREYGWVFFVVDAPTTGTGVVSLDFRYSWGDSSGDGTGHWNGPKFGGSSGVYGDFINRWHLVAVQYGAASTAAPVFFLNGVRTVGTVFFGLSPQGTADPEAGAPLVIGNKQNRQRTFDGTIDELRLIKSRPSAAWMTTEYRNQSSPGTFLAVGNEE